MRHEIHIFNRQEIEALEPPPAPYCVISITGSRYDRADLSRLRGARGVLRLVFDEDTFTPETARRVWEFVRAQDAKAQTYLVHCGAGQVRSASVACGLALFWGDGAAEVERTFEERAPRRDIYDTLCRAYAETFPAETFPAETRNR